MFSAGVASGDPTTSSVVLWTRCTPRPASLRWEVGTGSASILLASGEVVPDPGSDGTVRVEVTGLPPGTPLWFRFLEPDGSGSAVGATATLPAVADRFSLGVACCADWTEGPFDAYRWLADQHPDLVLHLGDYVYGHGDPGPHRHHDPPRTARTLDDHRRRYRQYRTDPDLLALHGAAPWISLWDDHEFQPDVWRRRRNRQSDGVATAASVDAAIRANLEWLPRTAETATSRSLDRHRRIGDLLDLIVIDCRLGRQRPVDDDDGPGLAPPSDHPTLLTDDQWRWLASILERPAPRWTVVASSVQVSPLRLGYLPAWRDRRPGLRALVNQDQWDGHPADRRRLVELLGPRAGSVLLVSGDLHGRFWTGVAEDGVALPELTVPSVSAASFARLVRRRLPLPRPVLEGLLRRLNPHISDLDLAHHGAAVLRVERDGITVSIGPEAADTRRLTGQHWPR